jgi:hypothetical protein
MTETRVNIITATCRRCEWTFRYVKQRYGRLRYYCEVCVILEAMDSNDARPRRTAQVRPGLRKLVTSVRRATTEGAPSASALREKKADGAPAGVG